MAEASVCATNRVVMKPREARELSRPRWYTLARWKTARKAPERSTNPGVASSAGPAGGRGGAWTRLGHPHGARGSVARRHCPLPQATLQNSSETQGRLLISTGPQELWGACALAPLDLGPVPPLEYPAPMSRAFTIMPPPEEPMMAMITAAMLCPGYVATM